jgi:5-methylthioadenosine/S-adenosylhomocysteine deaminase
LILIHVGGIHNQPVNDLFSQLVHCAKASDVQTVIVNGRVLMRDRQLQLADERKVLEEARNANLDLMTRVNALSF